MANRTTVLLALGWVACGSTVSTVIVDRRPLPNAWGALSLIVSGPDASDDKRDKCRDEARRAGINLVANAPVAATLLLDSVGNRVQLPSGERALGKWTAVAVCRVAIAYAIGIDQYVRVGKQEPMGCAELGPVEGEDHGFAFYGVTRGSYEAALAQLQFAGRQRGANYVVLEYVRHVGLSFFMRGRAFQCAAPAPPPETPEQQAPPYEAPPPYQAPPPPEAPPLPAPETPPPPPAPPQ